MGHIQGANRYEEIQFPQRLDAYFTADNPVRFIDAFADELDFESRGLRHAVAAASRRPSDHPGDLLKLYIYGYLCRSVEPVPGAGYAAQRGTDVAVQKAAARSQDDRPLSP